MPRRKRTPEEIARKAKVRELMQELDINDMSDIEYSGRIEHLGRFELNTFVAYD